MPPYLGIIRELLLLLLSRFSRVPTGNKTGVGSFRVDKIDRWRMPRGRLSDRKESLSQRGEFQ